MWWLLLCIEHGWLSALLSFLPFKRGGCNKWGLQSRVLLHAHMPAAQRLGLELIELLTLCGVQALFEKPDTIEYSDVHCLSFCRESPTCCPQRDGINLHFIAARLLYAVCGSVLTTPIRLLITPLFGLHLSIHSAGVEADTV